MAEASSEVVRLTMLSGGDDASGFEPVDKSFDNLSEMQYQKRVWHQHNGLFMDNHAS